MFEMFVWFAVIVLFLWLSALTITILFMQHQNEERLRDERRRH